MNLRKVQQWQLMFQEGKANIHKKHEGRPSLKLNKTVLYVLALIDDDCHLTITDMQRNGGTLNMKPARQQ